MRILTTYILFFSVLLSSNDLPTEFIKNDFNNFMNSSDHRLNDIDNKNTKNPLLGALFSAILPGTGQIYNGDYKRGIIYMAIELLSFSYRANYISKSKVYENKYKEFADTHWSFNKWVNDYAIFANTEHPVHSTMIDPSGTFFWPWDDSHHIEFHINESIHHTNNSGGDNWFYDKYILECENAMTNFEACNTSYFEDAVVTKDHHLYEGLGKYDLFFAGWDDTTLCEDSTINEYGSCSFIVSVGNKNNAFTKNKRYYQYELRDKANKKSDYAENALTLIFANHAISMFDAFISNLIKNRGMNFNYYSNPIYSNSSTLKLEGINFSILW